MAGLEIQRSLRSLGLRPAIGAATGVLFCGECGAAQRRQYSMIGPAINFAARLAGAVPDDLLADEPTTKAAGDRLSFIIARNVRPKHADETVLAFRPEPRQMPLADERVAQMVGRTAELAGLVGALQAARGGAGVRLLVSGEPGIGKSRLLRELRRTIEAGGTRTVAGAAQSLERDTPYFLVREVFRGLLGALARPGEAWRDTVSRHLQDDPALLAWAPLLGDILPLALPESDLTREMRGTARAAAIQALLLRLVDHACADGPFVVLADDLHWIDELSGAVLPALYLDRVLPTLAGRAMYGYRKHLARVSGSAPQQRVRTLSGATVLAAQLDAAGAVGSSYDFEHLGPVRAMMDQPIVTRDPLRGRLFSFMDYRFEQARITPLRGTVAVGAGVLGNPSAATLDVDSVLAAAGGAFRFDGGWTLTNPLESRALEGRIEAQARRQAP